MKSFRKELWFDLPARRSFTNITPNVEACLKESGIREGLVLCNAMHITASVFVNDDENGLHQVLLNRKLALRRTFIRRIGIDF